MLFCGNAEVAAASRMVYAFSRSRTLPGWQAWRRGNEKTKTPTRQGFGDLRVKPDLGTLRLLPHRAATVLVFGTPLQDDGTPVEVVPRRVLETQLQRMRELGYRVEVGIESEFVLYTDGPPCPGWWSATLLKGTA